MSASSRWHASRGRSPRDSAPGRRPRHRLGLGADAPWTCRPTSRRRWGEVDVVFDVIGGGDPRSARLRSCAAGGTPSSIAGLQGAHGPPKRRGRASSSCVVDQVPTVQPSAARHLLRRRSRPLRRVRAPRQRLRAADGHKPIVGQTLLPQCCGVAAICWPNAVRRRIIRRHDRAPRRRSCRMADDHRLAAAADPAR